MEQKQSNNNQGWGDNNPNSDKDLSSIQKTNPTNTKAQHPALSKDDQLKESGKDIGLVNAPIQSINPASSDQTNNDKPDEFDVFDNANLFVGQSDSIDYGYPFERMKSGQGFFVPATSTTDNLMSELHKAIFHFTQANAECEKDEKGDDVWESVVIQTKKRTDDGYIQTDSFSKPIVSANQTNRPKLIHSANFIVKPVVKGDKLTDGREADKDGALVIRV